MKSVFDRTNVEEIIQRIGKINVSSQPQWGVMRADQMLAHCCVPFEYIFQERNDPPPFFLKWLLRWFFKKAMVNEVPYPKNTRTAPMFVKNGVYDIEEQKNRLNQYIYQVLECGSDFFEGKEQISLGKLTAAEWNGLLYKHLDHHLRQFGV